MLQQLSFFAAKSRGKWRHDSKHVLYHFPVILAVTWRRINANSPVLSKLYNNIFMVAATVLSPDIVARLTERGAAGMSECKQAICGRRNWVMIQLQLMNKMQGIEI